MKIKHLSIAIVMGVLFLDGCNSTKESLIPELEPAERPKFEKTQSIVRNWSVGLGAGFDSSHVGLTPRLAGENVYAASPEGHVVAVNAETGRKAWAVNLRESISGGVGAGIGLIFVGTYEGNVYALDATSGDTRWKVAVSSVVTAPPMATDGRVVVRTADGRLSGLNVENGVEVWSIVRQVPSLSLLGDAEPLLERGVVIVGFPNGKLLAAELEGGRVLWEIPVAYPRGRNELERLVDVDARTSLVRGTLFSASYQGAIIALNLEERAVLWTSEVATHHPFAIDMQYLYAVDRDSRVVALNLLTGKNVWTNDKLLYRELSAPASLGPYIILSDFDGIVYVLDKRDGEFLGDYEIGGEGLVSQPLIRLDKAYLLNTSGELSSISAARR
ncbi:MAG: outer membrane protein assembly factor BamB [Arenicellaceae bacterium]|nr:outer membrane protein assembly factor BamB [Arenicellaceae bacterium]